MLAALLLAARTLGTAEGAGWPASLPPPERLGPNLAAEVERAWRQPTLVRSAAAEPVPVRLERYLAFVDAPDITAAAARHLGLAPYEVEALGEDWYRADDRDGATGVYRVLVRDGGRRVVLSWGTHRGSLLGTIRGHALSVMSFEASGEGTVPRLTAHVVIDHPVASRLARLLAPLFGGLVDRKLTEGFRVTARVAEWALADPARFCAWLAGAPLPAHRRLAPPAGVPVCPGLARGPLGAPPHTGR